MRFTNSAKRTGATQTGGQKTMIYTENIFQPITKTTRQTAVDGQVRYLDDNTDCSLVIKVQHDQKKLRDTTANKIAFDERTRKSIQIANQKQYQEENQMFQYRKGMMVVRQEDQATQRQAQQREQELRVLYEDQQTTRTSQTTQQRRRYQRGMMVITPLQ